MSTVRRRVSSSQGVARELRRLFPDPPARGLVVVGYDNDGRVCGMAVNEQHRALSWVKVWELSALADDLAARSVLVVVFPSGPAPTPSVHELAVFGDLTVRARRAGLTLLDCYVWRGEQMWSLRELRREQVSA